MYPNIFGKCILDPSLIQLRHKQKDIDCVNRDDTDPPTSALNDQLLSNQNGIFMLIISHNLQGKMVVWFDFCVKIFEILSGVLSIHNRCAFKTVFLIFTLSLCREQ